MSGLSKEYAGLMRKVVKDGRKDDESRPLKRRKKKSSSTSPTPDQSARKTPEGTRSHAPSGSPETQSGLAANQGKKPAPPTPDRAAIETEEDAPKADDATFTTKEVEDNPSDDDDDDDIDFEDVDITTVSTKASRMLQEDVVITVDKEATQPQKKSKRAANTIGKEERKFRKDFHRSYIACMIIHGAIRNRWVNDRGIQRSLKKLITVKVYEELHPSSTMKLPQMRTRAFLDGLRHLMEKWSSYYKVTSNKGLHKHDWYDWRGTERSPTDFKRFQRSMERGRGTRDIGAQGFVALLRAADVPSRLVFSLQPPDFTNRQIKGQKTEVTSEPKSQMTPHEKLLALRKGKTSVSANPRATQAEIEMVYPVFWAEAWDSTSKTWITIDPIMLKTIEDVKYKSKLEPPLSHAYNNLTYVIGYDRRNGVKDITKRYSEKYYSKTRKKRITKDESEEIWYSGFIDALNSRPPTKADQFEDEYFAKRAEKEGMPDNIQDFKGHPFYCLESQLKANEIIHPFEPCGMLRVKGGNRAIQVHKRANVQYLRSPRAWYQRGRVLKIGVKPMKVRQKTSMQMSRNLAFDDDDEDKEERLYAEFQTELYVPPPAIDGLIEKNTYGNIDVFVPSMIPEGAVLISSTHAEDAAKALGIDYAHAVVGFKFDRRQATPKIGGVVVGADFKEAMEVVQEQLKAEAAEKERAALEIRALKGWNLLLTKLRIKQRLDKSHGKLEEDTELNSDEEFEKMQKEYEAYVANDDEEDELSFGEDDGDEDETQQEHIMTGGFLAEDAIWDPKEENDNVHEANVEGGSVEQENGIEVYGGRDNGGFLSDYDEETIGGFIADDGKSADDNGGGFLPDSPKEQTSGDNDVDVLEDYEAFLNELGDEYGGSDEDEGSIDPREYAEVHHIEGEGAQTSDDVEADDSDELPETEQKVTETIVLSSEEPERPAYAFIEDTRETGEVISEGDITPPRQLAQTKKLTDKVPETMAVETEAKQLSQDDELEKQFNEQLEQERRSTPGGEEVIDIPDEDDDFEYYSD